VVYTTAADFARDYAAAVDADRVDAWRSQIRRAELFVCENLGELAGKPAAQQELIHTIDVLQAQESSLVFTAASLANHWPSLVPALRSRLSAFLAIGLALPSRATRAALLRQLAAIRGMPLSDREVSQLAGIAGGAPQLVAALYRLALARQAGGASETEWSLSSDLPARQPSLREIAHATAKHLGLKLTDLKGPARQRSLVNARGVAMHLARQLTTSSLEQIGRYFGGRDHTTVLHACRRTEKLLRRDRATRQTIAELKRLLRLAAT
jgi:chromosomal replication initiator protein